MKTLKQIREASGGKEAYQKFFNSLLKKFGVKSPAELDDAKKKEFYDAIDKGWEGDNEKPEKNERYDDPDNLDPETTVDSDEDMADKAASQINASYGKMNASKKKKKMNASYHKESVNEAKKLKAGRGKAEIDINFDGDRKDIKFATTKYMVKIKPHRDGAIVTGDKAKILAYLQGQDYAMDPEDIEDLYPELMESSHPKPLSIIRQVKEFSGDAETVRRKKRRFEDMVMCEHCGKMHEEGACMEADNDLDPETKGMEEAKTVKLNRPEKHIFDLAMTAIARSNDAAKARTKRGVEKYMDYEGMDLIDDITGVSLTDNEKNNVYNAVRDALNAKTRESVEEANRLSVKLKGNASKLFDLAKKQGIKNKAYGDKEWNKAVDQAADEMGKKVNFKDIAAVKQAMMHESVEEAVRQGKKIKGAKLGKAYPVLDAGTQRKVKAIAKKHSGDMERALKDIEKLKKGLGDNPDVMDILKKANEDVNEGVAVDRRTKGFKAAMIRNEKAKKVREKSKAKKEKKKDQAELDARYDYDGEVDTVLAAANAVMNNTKLETAANAVAHGGVDMAPNAGKKKKDKEKIFARKY